MRIEPIGYVRSPVKASVDENWGDVVSEILLIDSLSEGLKGIGEFSHALIVFHMHEADFEAADDLVRRPQGRADMPETGIFAQRARHRPNPIGVTTVKVLETAGSILKVKGLDAIDGTPVLDVKPYFPQFDQVESPTMPEWVDLLMKDYFKKIK